MGTSTGLMAAVALLAIVAPAEAQSQDHNYSHPPNLYCCPSALEVTAVQVDTIRGVLDAINSPERRSTLAEQWVQFSKQAITKSLAFQDQWLTLQRQQLQNQQQGEQLRVEILRMQAEIEKMRAENLRLQNENLQLQMQLKQQQPQQPQPQPQQQSQTSVSTPNLQNMGPRRTPTP
jgi:predicted phage tail protein